jgi:hypothetical protein
MTEQELMREVKTDFVNAFRISNYHDQKFRRMVIKSSRFPVFTQFEYTSPRKNRWIIFLEAHSKKEIGDKSRITFVCIYQAKHGYYAVMVTFTNKKQHLVIYAPHLFSRYAERCGVKLSGVELMKHFFKRNSNYVYDIRDTVINENTAIREIYGSTAEGVAMGFMSTEGNVMFRTFITYDMTKGEQINKFAENERIRREIHDNN